MIRISQGTREILNAPWSQFPAIAKISEDPDPVTYDAPYSTYSIQHHGLVFSLSSPREQDALFCLELLHRVVDVLQDYFREALSAAKIEANYDVVALLLYEMIDDGMPVTTEPNALKDAVPQSNLLDKFMSTSTMPSAPSSIPWRRANVKHTNNEMYVDIEEMVNCIYSGDKCIVAQLHGRVKFKSKLSGMPDLLLVLSSPSTLDLPALHPCVRTRKWLDNPGSLSFIPPDGRCILMSYQMSLPSPRLPIHANLVITETGFSVQLSCQKVSAKIALDLLQLEIPLPETIRSVGEPSASSGLVHFRNGMLTWHFSKPPTLPSSAKLDVEVASGSGVPPYVKVMFSTSGWLISGCRVESLSVLRGLNDSVRPYKGVKYMTGSGEYIIRPQ